MTQITDPKQQMCLSHIEASLNAARLLVQKAMQDAKKSSPTSYVQNLDYIARELEDAVRLQREFQLSQRLSPLT